MMTVVKTGTVVNDLGKPPKLVQVEKSHILRS